MNNEGDGVIDMNQAEGIMNYLSPFLPHILSLLFSDQSPVIDFSGPLTVSIILHVMFILTHPDIFTNAHR